MPPSVRYSRQGHACVSQAIGYKLYLIRFENFIWWPRDVLNNESESCFFLSCWDQMSKRVIPTVKLDLNGFFHHFKLTNIYPCVTRVKASCLNTRLQTLFNYIWELCIDALWCTWHWIWKTVSFLSCCEQLTYFRDLSITLDTIEQSFKNVYKEYNLPSTYAKQWRLWNFSKGLRATILVHYSISLKIFLFVIRNRNRKVFACMQK